MGIWMRDWSSSFQGLRTSLSITTEHQERMARCRIYNLRSQGCKLEGQDGDRTLLVQDSGRHQRSCEVFLCLSFYFLKKYVLHNCRVQNDSFLYGVLLEIIKPTLLMPWSAPSCWCLYGPCWSFFCRVLAVWQSGSGWGFKMLVKVASIIAAITPVDLDLEKFWLIRVAW